MQSIEEEIELLISFLMETKFNVSVKDLLFIKVIDINGPGPWPHGRSLPHYEVQWEIKEENMVCQYHKTFVSLREAATFFVEKRRYMVIGYDFEEEIGASK